MKTLLSFLALILAFPSFGGEVECRVEYAYKKGTNTNGYYPGGIGQPMTGWDEFAIYKKCKNYCFIKNSNNYPDISHVSGCYINNEPLEKSKFKAIYNKNKKNICHITAYKNGKKQNGHYLDTTKNENTCKKLIPTKYWCQKGYECKYTYGKW